jgi:hypothetical protein
MCRRGLCIRFIADGILILHSQLYERAQISPGSVHCASEVGQTPLSTSRRLLPEWVFFRSLLVVGSAFRLQERCVSVNFDFIKIVQRTPYHTLLLSDITEFITEPS